MSAKNNKDEDLFSVLEFDRILDQLTQLTISPLGRELVHQLKPSTDPRWIEESLEQVSQMRAILDFDEPFPIQGIKDIRKAIQKTALAGNTLSIPELADIAHTLTAGRLMKNYFRDRKRKYPLLGKLAQQLQVFKEVEEAIAKALDFSSLEIKDEASKELARTRKEIAITQERLREKLNSILLRAHNYVQEPIITLREGRMVIPVREEHRGRVKGLVHDRSASGATLFIEPLEALELNNRVRELQIQEKKEIERILRQITATIGASREEIESNLDILAQFDLIYAKAHLSQRLGGWKPGLNTENRIEIVNGRHPILVLRSNANEEIVPLNLEMGERFRTLVITGPNAGGKTVALKTVGILTLMAQCGLHIPAEETSEIAIFHKIFADIGDQQSIERDLSTFSAHMQGVRKIVNGADEHSLVLIDEIGAGTDPAEGAALATALLENLTARGCITIATTHQGALKAFAHETEGVENGAMEFDQRTLQPTYKLRLGIPGSSYAFEIAQRLEIPQNIIQRSRALVGSERGRLDELILDLENKTRHYEALVREVDIKRSELQALVELYRNKYEELRRNEKALKKKALQECKGILAKANALVEKAVREIRSRGADRDSIKAAKTALQKRREEVDQQLETMEAEKRHSVPKVFKEGDKVLWKGSECVGTVLSKGGPSGKVMVEMGNVTLWANAADLELVTEDLPPRATRLGVKIEVERQIGDELDVRGMRVDEVTNEIDKYLDKAYLAGFEQVRIIHGKGTGALRNRISQYLRDHPRVKNQRFGSWNEGDTGATIVELNK